MTKSSLPHGEPVVIVTGLPRSGTSMMMRMLEAGGMSVIVDGLRKADTDNPYGYYEYEPVKMLKQDSSWIVGAGGKAVKMVYRLLYDLPPSVSYKLIFMKRVLEEVVASQDEMLRRSGVSVFSDESRRLIGLFQVELGAVENWIASKNNLQVLYVDYRRTVDEPRETCARISEFLNQDLDEGRMASIVTPVLYRKRRSGLEGPDG